jgi:hypothetical protein
MSTQTTDARPARGRSHALLRVPVLAGIAYLVVWVASQLLGAPNLSVAASGAQVVTSFAGHGGPNMAMFVLAEGITVVALVVVAVAVARAVLHGGAPPRARLAARVGAGFAIAAAVLAWVELALGVWLISALVPEGRSGTAGTVYHAVTRMDGAKMFLLAVMVAALSALALSSPLLPRWLAPLGFVAAAALVVSGLGWVLLAPGLANSVYVSGVLMVAFVTCTGVTFGLRDGSADG